MRPSSDKYKVSLCYHANKPGGEATRTQVTCGPDFAVTARSVFIKKARSRAEETGKAGQRVAESSVSGTRAASQLGSPAFQEQIAENRKWPPLLRNQELVYKACTRAEDS